MSQFSSRCLNFRLDVSFFLQQSHFSSRCFISRLVVSIFGWMSQFSSRCLKFSSSCLNFHLFRWLDCRLDLKYWQVFQLDFRLLAGFPARF
ncbi:hypothetical protein V9T40_006608 [Parthenolecanium corni]|uniref:Uncharacterized protein n=1 Tax=Parthenolecanium corni TaxID=536013 RepID=A0AAN9TNZ7_9HEMI